MVPSHNATTLWLLATSTAYKQVESPLRLQRQVAFGTVSRTLGAVAMHCHLARLALQAAVESEHGV